MMHSHVDIGIAEDRRKRLKIQCEKWLKPAALKEVHHRRLAARTRGTCQWIQNNRTFLKWRDLQTSTTSEKVLFISGTHGCGKSILAAAVTEHFLTEGHRTLFFYFSSTDTNIQKADSVARSLLAQLLRQDHGDGIADSLTRVMDTGEQQSSSELWDALKAALSIGPVPTFCVLDGIDESSEQREVLTKLSALLEEVEHMKCVLLARPQVFEDLPPLIDAKQWLVTMDSALTQHDIDAFLTDELDKFTSIQVSGLRSLAFDTLQEKSSSSFLWVRLMISDLGKACSNYELKERLQNVPESLEDAYRMVFSRMIQRLDGRELRRAQVILGLVITARRPLRLEELIYPLALSMRADSKTTQTSIEEFIPLDPQKTILHACGDMVSICGGVVHLSHSSVKDFLCRDERDWAGPDDRPLTSFRIDLAETHGHFAALCLDYLDLEDHGYPLKEPDTVLDIRRTHHFVEYASYNFFFHYQKSNAHLASVQDKLRSISSTLRLISWIENCSLAWIEDSLEWKSSSRDGFDEDFCRAWYGIMTCDDYIRQSVEAQLKAEIAVRTRQSGYDGIGVGILTKFLDLISSHETDAAFPMEDGYFFLQGLEFHVGESLRQIDQEDPSTTTIVPDHAYQNMTTIINDATNFLDQSQLIQSRGVANGIVILLKMWHHASLVQNIQKITDPLMLLFRIILAKASALPVYAVLGLCQFYLSLDKFDQVLQLCQAILPRVDGSGSRAEGMVYTLMAWAYEELENEVECVKCTQRAVLAKESSFLAESTRKSLSGMMSDHPEDKCNFFKKLLEQDQKRYGEQAECTLRTRLELGLAFEKLNLQDEAVEMMRVTWKIGKRRGKRDSSATLEAGLLLGEWMTDQEQFEEAEKVFQELCKELGSATQENHDRYRRAYNLRGVVMWDLRRYEDSLDFHQQAYRAVRKFRPTCDPILLTNLIITLTYTTNYKQSSNRKEMMLNCIDLDTNSNEDVRLLKFAGSYLDEFSFYEEALEIGRMVLDANLKRSTHSPPDIYRSRLFVIEVLQALGRPIEIIAETKLQAEFVKQQCEEDGDGAKLLTEFLEDQDDVGEAKSLADVLDDLNRWIEEEEWWLALLMIDVGEFAEN